MKTHGPIGARDISTLNFLNDNNIPSYFSGCLTLTLDKNPNIKKQDYIVTVDVPKELINFLKTKTNKKIYDVTQMAPLDINKPHEIQISIYNSNEKFIIANGLLDLYQGASCVITNRLHVALPCLAFKTPVLLINNYTYDVDRFSGLKDLINNASLEKYTSDFNIFNVNNPPENKKNYLKLRNELINRCKKFTGHVNEDRTMFQGDINFFTSLISKTSRNINTHVYNYNSLMRKNSNNLKSKELTIKKQKETINKTNKEIKLMKNNIKKQKKTIIKMESSNSWKISKPLRLMRSFLNKFNN